MPKNPVADPITDQEVAFAHLVMSGTMNDRAAAEAAGLNPETAAYTKAKPRVRAYMAEHRAAVSQRLVEQQARELSQFSIGRERILKRLWELAMLNPQVTRGSASVQMKAISLIIAIEGHIPDRRARGQAQRAAVPPHPFTHMHDPGREQTTAPEDWQPVDEAQQESALVHPPQSTAPAEAAPEGISGALADAIVPSMAEVTAPVQPASGRMFDIPHYTQDQQPLATRMNKRW